MAVALRDAIAATGSAELSAAGSSSVLASKPRTYRSD